MKKFSFILFVLPLLFCLMWSPSSQAVLQKLNFDKLYLKWLDGNFENPSKCFKASDHVLDSDQAPQLLSDKHGLYYWIEVEVDRIKEGCGSISLSPGQKAADLALKIEDSKGEFDATRISLKARLPFEHVIFQDSEGRKLELLLEGKLKTLEDTGFLRFFKRSRFAGRIFSVTSPSFQTPIALLDYELPTFFAGRALLQIQLGQSLFSLSSTPIYFGFYDLALAWRWVGRGHPFEEPFNFKTRLSYEGVQINDPQELGLYPLLGTRLFGGGIEFSSRLAPNWAVWNRTDYLMGITELYSIKKIKSSAAISYKLSRRWRVESGMRFSRFTQSNRLLLYSESVNETGFFLGMRLNPENLLD